ELHQEILVLLLAAEGQILTRRTVAKGVLPVQRCHDGLDLAGSETARIQTANDGAHASACNRIDGDMQLFEYLENTDVRRPARTASGEHQADSRPMRAESCRGLEGGRWSLRLGRDGRGR